MSTTTAPETPTAAAPQRRPWTVPVILLLFIAVLATVAWAFTERQNADELAAEVEALTQESEAEGWLRADLSAFEAAYESGDYEQVRALYTDDGIVATTGGIQGFYYGDEPEAAGTWEVGGEEFRRLATLHEGQDFKVLGTPIAVGGNTVAFAWQWGNQLEGTALLYLRDDKIVVAVLNPSQVWIPPRE